MEYQAWIPEGNTTESGQEGGFSSAFSFLQVHSTDTGPQPGVVIEPLVKMS